MIADYCIVGGGIAGTTAAEQIRKLDQDARIVLLEREPYPLYSRVLIPHYLKDKIPRTKLFLRTVADYERQDISLYMGAEAMTHDPVRHEVGIRWGDGEDICTYKKLLIASGGTPKEVPAPFNEHNEIPVLRMQTLSDADRIKKVLDEASPKDALVVGEGFIGLEFIETYAVHGFRMKVLCRKEVFLEDRFGSVGGYIFEDLLQKHGVEFLRKVDESKFETMTFTEHDGSTHPPSVIGMGIGIERSLKPFEGVEKKRGIVVDKYLHTADPDIFAAGDVAEYYDELSSMHTVSGNWNNAFLQGVTAAKNMVSAKRHEDSMAPFSAIPVYSIVHLGLIIMVIGDMKNTDDIWERAGSVYDPFLVRIGLRNGVVVGAALINRSQLQTTIVKFIKEKTTKHVLETTI
jgi:3-phenylpropionate/trans-cinnamate dioxygenase ferredoxin reductase subunit